MKTEEKVILAADELDKDSLLNLIKQIGPKVYCVKIHNLYDIYGPSIIQELRSVGAGKVWVDFKLYDIPNTVKLRARALAESGCDILTVHASGGVEMLKAAKEGFGSGKVYAVTALTSLSDESLKRLYKANSAEELVIRLAWEARSSDIDGLVCSPKEIAAIRSMPEFANLDLAVPGIRSAGISADDQQRFDTPLNALKAGANFLVIGRQITKSTNPLAAIDDLQKEIANV